MSETKTAIREIEWTVAEDLLTLSPGGVQDAGVQGEHNATLVRFRLPEAMANKEFRCDVEHVTAYGEYDVASDPEIGLVQASRPNEAGNMPETYTYPQVVCLLPEAWTQHGGEATLRLVVYTEGTDEERMVAFTVEGRIRYKEREGLVKRVSSVIEQTVRALLARCRLSVEEAETAGEKAVEDTEAAKEKALSAINTAADAATKEARDYAAAAESAAEKAETKVESLIERNSKRPVSLWVGTQAEYDAIAEKDETRLYLISDEALSDYANPHNLLDNSDFTKPVNQRGKTSLTSAGAIDRYEYFIDRWLVNGRSGLSDVKTVYTLTDEGIKTTGEAGTYADFMQRFGKGYFKDDGDYTLVIYYADDTTEVKRPTDGKAFYVTTTYTDYDEVFFYVDEGKTIAHVALYEGVYTAESAPAYRPKGYAAELAECQRYYRNINKGILNGYITGGGANLWISLPFAMCKAPIVTCYGTTFTVRTIDGYYKNTENVGAPSKCTYDGGNFSVLAMQWDEGAVLGTNNTPASLEIRFGGGIELSADY